VRSWTSGDAVTGCVWTPAGAWAGAARGCWVLNIIRYPGCYIIYFYIYIHTYDPRFVLCAPLHFLDKRSLDSALLIRAHLGARAELTQGGRPPEGEFRGNFYPPNFLGGKPPLLGAVWEQRREIPGIVEKLVKWKKRKKINTVPNPWLCDPRHCCIC
jgi:hypothetical protein